MRYFMIQGVRVCGGGCWIWLAAPALMIVSLVGGGPAAAQEGPMTPAPPVAPQPQPQTHKTGGPGREFSPGCGCPDDARATGAASASAADPKTGGSGREFSPGCGS